MVSERTEKSRVPEKPVALTAGTNKTARTIFFIIKKLQITAMPCRAQQDMKTISYQLLAVSNQQGNFVIIDWKLMLSTDGFHINIGTRELIHTPRI
jgi:hypothetical protein